jgi:hypothetical protein
MAFNEINGGIFTRNMSIILGIASEHESPAFALYAQINTSFWMGKNGVSIPSHESAQSWTVDMAANHIVMKPLGRTYSGVSCTLHKP